MYFEEKADEGARQYSEVRTSGKPPAKQRAKAKENCIHPQAEARASSGHIFDYKLSSLAPTSFELFSIMEGEIDSANKVDGNQTSEAPGHNPINCISMNSNSHMTNTQKLRKRQGILKVKLEAQSKGNFSLCDAVLDTAAARGAVQPGSKYLLPRNSKAEKRARDSLFFKEDTNLFEAVAKGKPAYVKSFHGQKKLTCEDLGIITIRIGKTLMNLLVIIAKPGILPEGIELLLDTDTVQQARIDVTALLALRDQMPGVVLSLAKSPRVKTRDDKQPLMGMQRSDIAFGAPPEWQGFVENHERREQDENDIGAAPARMKLVGSTKEIANHDSDMFLSEIKCKAAMIGSPDLFKPKTYTVDMVKIAGDDHLTGQQQQKLKALVREFKRIFSGKNVLPKTMKNHPPAKLLFKEGAEPARCAIPRWGPYQEKLLRIWTQQSLKEGLIELVTAEKYPRGCPYASRPHIVSKPNGGVRVTGDYVKVNDTIEKRPLNLPNMEDQLRRHLGAKYFTVADAAQGYYQLDLHEESRQLSILCC